MVLEPVLCPDCGSDNVRKYGKDRNGKQRYSCTNKECNRTVFIKCYTYQAYKKGIKEKIIEMSLNGSGIRDISRVLKISTDTVINELKKMGNKLETVNRKALENLDSPEDVKIKVVKVEEVEMDEMWSFVGSKKNPRWLWHAINHETGEVLAYVFGTRKDEVFLELKALLEPFGIEKFYTDNWGAYDRNIDESKHFIGKRNTQKIERKHLTLRTRIKRLCRKTICFSKSILMHDIVIGLFINKHEFGLAV